MPPADRSDLLLRGIRLALLRRSYRAACNQATVLTDLLDGAAAVAAHTLTATLAVVARARGEQDALGVRDGLGDAMRQLDDLARAIERNPAAAWSGANGGRSGE